MGSVRKGWVENHGWWVGNWDPTHLMIKRLLSHLSVISAETRVREKVPMIVLPARSNEATFPITTGAISEEAWYRVRSFTTDLCGIKGSQMLSSHNPFLPFLTQWDIREGLLRSENSHSHPSVRKSIPPPWRFSGGQLGKLNFYSYLSAISLHSLISCWSHVRSSPLK